MTRSLPLLLLAVLAAPALAQEPPPPISLTLSPKAAPVPALKYRLLPELRDLKSGNAVFLYYRAFSPEWQTYRSDSKQRIKLSETADKPLRELKRADFDEFGWILNSRMLQEVDRGARRSYCDWELTERAREEGIGLLLPDLQTMRDFGNFLRLRAKQELFEGHYDKAARTLQTGLTLGRHTAEGPTLIHGLVGVAICDLMLKVVEDWINQPGSPNLYWALSNLPHPLIDLRNGFQAERLFLDSLFPGYREMLADPNAPPSSARVQTTLQQYAGMLSLDDSRREPSQLMPLLSALRAYPEAKRFLREQGRTPEQIEAMPALQAVFLYEVHHYDVIYDDLLKWTGLPYYQAVPHVHRVMERMKAERAATGGMTLASLLMPALEKVMAAPVRLERKVAALRTIEALRLYAAAHGGKLPARLEDVTEVPLPLDPWTGKAFRYRLEDGKATLSGEPLGGEAPGQSNTIRYELTIRTEKGEK
jgi:hypothetical protein